MAIRGIDTQIMVTNTAEYQKDASALQRKNELNEDYQAAMVKAVVDQEQNTVTTSSEVQEANVKLDKDAEGGQDGAAGSKDSRKKKENAEYTDPNQHLLDQLRTDNMYKIDIQV